MDMEPKGGVQGLVSMKDGELMMMWEAIFAPVNLQKAWKQVRANRGAPGVDGLSVEEFPDWKAAHWEEIREKLEGGRYRPAPVRRVEIDKPGGGKRPLGIPVVLDRLIQQAIAQVLSGEVDGSFHPSSYGFRPGKSAHGAIQQLQADFRSGYLQAVDLDLESRAQRDRRPDCSITLKPATSLTGSTTES